MKLTSLFFSSLKNFIKVFQDLGAKNLEPVRVAVLLKHPFIQDLISSYSDYKIPVSIIPRCPNSVKLRIRAWWDVSSVDYRDRGEAGAGQTRVREAKLVKASG